MNFEFTETLNNSLNNIIFKEETCNARQRDYVITFEKVCQWQKKLFENDLIYDDSIKKCFPIIIQENLFFDNFYDKLILPNISICEYNCDYKFNKSILHCLLEWYKDFKNIPNVDNSIGLMIVNILSYTLTLNYVK